MLIILHEKNKLLQYGGLVLLAAGLWIRPFITTCIWELPDKLSPLSREIISFFGSDSQLLAAIGFALVILQAFYLNSVLIKNKIIPGQTTLGAIIYILLMSQTFRALTLNQVLLASTFVIPAVDILLRSTKKTNNSVDLLLSSTLLTIGSLFCFPLVFFIPLLLMAVFIFNLRPRLQALLASFGGVLLVYIFYGLYISLSGNLHDTLQAYTLWFTNPPLFWQYIDPGYYLLIAWQIWLFVAAARRLLINLKTLEINHRNNLVFGLCFVILSIISALYYIDEQGLGLLPIAIPFTMFLSGYLVLNTQKKWVWMQEMIFFSWYLGVFVMNIYIAKC